MIEGHAGERAAQADARGRIKGALSGLDGEKEAVYGAVAVCFRTAHEELKALEDDTEEAT